MRLDPLDTISHTIVSIPARLLLAWATGTAGAFAPLFIRHGFDAFEVMRWQFLFFPFYLFVLPFFSGWWGGFGVPLLVVFAWRMAVFLREESDVTDLAWLFVLPCLIGIRASGDSWPLVAILAGGLVFGLWRAGVSKTRPQTEAK